MAYSRKPRTTSGSRKNQKMTAKKSLRRRSIIRGSRRMKSFVGGWKPNSIKSLNRHKSRTE